MIDRVLGTLALITLHGMLLFLLVSLVVPPKWERRCMVAAKISFFVALGVGSFWLECAIWNRP